MSRLTRSTTRRLLKRFLRLWAIKPSISRAYRPSRAVLDLGFRLAALLLVEDRLHPLLLAALDQAPVLGDVDRDPLARHHVGVPPHTRVAARDHALPGVVIIGPVGRPPAT